MKITPLNVDGWADVRFAEDSLSGLRAIIAVHDLTLGPSLGGCRRWIYKRDEDALEDVKRLSRGMTYKNSLAGLNLGGGKSVILAEEGQEKTPELFRAFGRFVKSFEGTYIAAEDVGMSPEDLTYSREETRHVVGLTQGDAASGDPSPMTALGVFHGMRAACAHAFGSDNLRGVKVAIQGLGHVGWNLAQRLHDAGARLVVADIRSDIIEQAKDRFTPEVADADSVLEADVDIVAPCALGAVITDDLADTMRAKIIAGAANNQLAHEGVEPKLKRRGILYAPDYAINAAGVINAAGEAGGEYDRAWVEDRARRIYDTIAEILRRAEAEGSLAGQVADAIAMERIETVRAEGRSYAEQLRAAA